MSRWLIAFFIAAIIAACVLFLPTCHFHFDSSISNRSTTDPKASQEYDLEELDGSSELNEASSSLEGNSKSNGGEAHGTIIGSILTEGGTPIPGAQVKLGDLESGAHPTTGGHFEINGLKAGKYKLIALAPGWIPVEKGVAVVQVGQSEQEVSLKENEKKEVRFVFRGGQNFSAKMVYPDGSPAEGVTLMISNMQSKGYPRSSQDKKSDASGHVNFTGIARGKIYYYISCSWYGLVAYADSLEDLPNEFEVAWPAILEVHLNTGNSGAALPDSLIAYRNKADRTAQAMFSDHLAITAELNGGVARFRLANGDYQMSFGADQFKTSDQFDIRLHHEDPNILKLSLLPKERQDFTFVIRGSEEDEAIAGAKLEIDNEILLSDGSGQASIELKEQRYHLRISHPSYCSYSKSLLLDGASREVKIHLMPATLLTVNVNDQNGEGVPGVIINTRRVNPYPGNGINQFGRDRNFTPSAQPGPGVGSLIYNKFPLGHYRFSVRRNHLSWGSYEYHIHQQSQQQIEIVLPDAFEVYGEVSGLEEISPSYVAFYSSLGMRYATANVVDGSYSVKFGEEGDYRVVLSGEKEWSSVRYYRFSKSTRLDIELNELALEGQLLLADGSPAARFEIKCGGGKDPLFTTTDHEGRFQFSVLAGEKLLEVLTTRKGSYFEPRTVAIHKDKSIEWSAKTPRKLKLKVFGTTDPEALGVSSYSVILPNDPTKTRLIPIDELAQEFLIPSDCSYLRIFSHVGMRIEAAYLPLERGKSSLTKKVHLLPADYVYVSSSVYMKELFIEALEPGLLPKNSLRLIRPVQNSVIILPIGSYRLKAFNTPGIAKSENLKIEDGDFSYHVHFDW